MINDDKFDELNELANLSIDILELEVMDYIVVLLII
jgi:hypothetical protein